jgi:hypothetical protein
MKISISKRKNSLLNPKENAYDKIVSYRGANKYISFTKFPKLGINPRSTFDTPIGIYTYPLDFLIDEHFVDGKIWAPYPGEESRTFAWIIEPASRVFDLNTGHIDVSNLSMLLYRYVFKLVEKHRIGFSKKDEVLAFEEIRNLGEEAYETAREDAGDDGDGRFVWYFTHNFATHSSEYLDGIIEANPHVLWNRMLRLLGYDVWVDDGDSIIHENEPTQAVFLTIKSFKLVEKIQIKEYNDLKAYENIPTNLKPSYLVKEKEVENRKYISVMENVANGLFLRRDRAYIEKNSAYPLLLDNIKSFKEPVLSKVLGFLLRESLMDRNSQSFRLHSTYHSRLVDKLKSLPISNISKLLLRGADYYLNLSFRVTRDAGLSLDPPYVELYDKILKSQNPILLLGLTAVSMDFNRRNFLLERLRTLRFDHEVKNSIIPAIEKGKEKDTLKRILSPKRLSKTELNFLVENNKKVWKYIYENKESVFRDFSFNEKRLEIIVDALTRKRIMLAPAALEAFNLVSTTTITKLYLMGVLLLGMEEPKNLFLEASRFAVSVLDKAKEYDLSDPRILAGLLAHKKLKDRTFFEDKIGDVDDLYQGLSHDKLTDKLREISYYGALGNLL